MRLCVQPQAKNVIGRIFAKIVLGGLRKRKPKSLDLESKTLYFLAKQSEPKTITLFEVYNVNI